MLTIPIEKLVEHLKEPFSYNVSRGGLEVQYDSVIIDHTSKPPCITYLWHGQSVGREDMVGMVFKLDASGIAPAVVGT